MGSNKPQKRRPGTSGNASKRSLNGRVAGAPGSVVGSHTPAFHPLTSTHGRYPRVPMAVMPPSPRAAKSQREAEAARLNGNRVTTDRPICPARAEVHAGWDRPSTSPALTRGTFGTSYTVPRCSMQTFPAQSRSTTPREATDAVHKKAGTMLVDSATAGQRRKVAMARLFPQPVANFKAPALELKGRNMKEAAQDIPDGHFVVGGRVYKLSDTARDDEQRGGDGASSEAIRQFLERKQPDEVPPWTEHGSGTVPESSGGRKTSGTKQNQLAGTLQGRGCQGRAQQLGPFGSGRGSDAGAGGRPWSPVEPHATKVNARALSTPPGVVNRKHVERSGWMWRPLSQGGPIVAAFGESAPMSKPHTPSKPSSSLWWFKPPLPCILLLLLTNATTVILIPGEDGKIAAVVPATAVAYRQKPGTPGRRVSPRAQSRAASARGTSRNSARKLKQASNADRKLAAPTEPVSGPASETPHSEEPIADPKAEAREEMREEVIEDAGVIEG